MYSRIFLFLLLSFCFAEIEAQLSPTQIRYTAWDIHALRFYPFKESADSIIAQTIRRMPVTVRQGEFSRTSVDLLVDKEYLLHQRTANDWPYSLLIKPYVPWMQYAHPFQGDIQILNIARFDDSAQSVLDIFGTDNIEYLVKESIGEIDLRKKENEVFMHSIKTPLNPDYSDQYHFFLSELTEVDSHPCYKLVFFSKEKKAKTYEGYLYVSRTDYSLLKAVFTLNASLAKQKNEEVIFTQTPDQLNIQTFIGNGHWGNLLLSQVQVLDRGNLELQRPELTPAQKDFDHLLETANRTPAYLNLQKGAYFFLTEQIPVNKFDFGPVLQSISHNNMEGLRLRAGGNTSDRFSRKIQLGGYVAYGIKDMKWKYRGDLSYAFTSNDRFSFSYISDLNIPGYDLLNSRRDNLFYSFTHSRTDNMSLQQIATLNYEKNLPGFISLHIGGKYLSDRPQGKVQYFRLTGDTPELIPELKSSELQFGLRYAPDEKYIRVGRRKTNFRKPDLILEMNYRIGIKDLFQSDYSYQITDFSAYKKATLPADIGMFTFHLSGGKVWNEVPFPLLFIPAGNQSYIYDPQDHNLMKFYEFITDQYVAGNLSLEFNWSVFDLFTKSSVKTGLGIRSIYGPLSRKNDPSSRPDLFVFNNGVSALDNRPYTEVNVGLINLLKIFRVDYVHRLNYDKKGSLFLTSSFLF
jgi:hypothetical protein